MIWLYKSNLNEILPTETASSRHRFVCDWSMQFYPNFLFFFSAILLPPSANLVPLLRGQSEDHFCHFYFKPMVSKHLVTR